MQQREAEKRLKEEVKQANETAKAAAMSGNDAVAVAIEP
jgi:hypothetical protein